MHRPTRSACHNIVRQQLHQEKYPNPAIELPQLLDPASDTSRRSTGPNSTIFCRIGLGEVLATYLQFCGELLGQKAPRLRLRPRVGEIENFRQIVQSAEATKKPRNHRHLPRRNRSLPSS